MLMGMVSAEPPWYYRFHFGTIWSIVFMAVMVLGALVFFLVRKKEGKWTNVKVVSAVVAIVGVLLTLASLLAFV